MHFSRTFPEELLHYILAIHFDRVPEVFCNSHLDPHYNGIPVIPSSAALLVSKKWRRVGTPLLYVFLSISNKDHAKAVAEVIREDPSLALRTRHVRLRGGLGKYLGEILVLARNIDTISIDIRKVKSGHSIVGLRKALPALNPSALYVNHDSTPNKQRAEAASLLYAAIQTSWTNLKKFHFISSLLYVDEAVDAIIDSSSIEEILIYCRHLYDYPYSLTNSPRISQDSKIKRMLYRNSDLHQQALQHDGWPGDNPVKMRMQRVTYPDDPWLEAPDGKTSNAVRCSCD